MQSRAKYQRLPGHHAPPAYANDETNGVSLSDDQEVQEEEAQRMEGAAQGRQDQTPEIQAFVALEAQPDPELELDRVDPGYTAERSYHHGRREVQPIGLWVVRVGSCHGAVKLGVREDFEVACLEGASQLQRTAKGTASKQCLGSSMAIGPS